MSNKKILNKNIGGENSSRLPSLSDVSKIQGLDFNNRQFPEFNYDNYLDKVRLSNFAQGGGQKNLKNILKKTYLSYIQGCYSPIKLFKQIKNQGGGEFPVSDSQLRNLKYLDHKTPFEIPKWQVISKPPHSNFGM